jgi:hypothetical protein
LFFGRVPRVPRVPRVARVARVPRVARVARDFRLALIYKFKSYNQFLYNKYKKHTNIPNLKRWGILFHSKRI